MKKPDQKTRLNERDHKQDTMVDQKGLLYTVLSQAMYNLKVIPDVHSEIYKIRRSSWDKSLYVCIHSSDPPVFDGLTEKPRLTSDYIGSDLRSHLYINDSNQFSGTSWNPTLGDLLANDWEELYDNNAR